ncbi:MAG TPA: hypothetical protein VKS82_07810 [Streptosporangiaceae bacterium]|nr:hypothetical protein [Streptosporangiaceae bacterium]
MARAAARPVFFLPVAVLWIKRFLPACGRAADRRDFFQAAAVLLEVFSRPWPALLVERFSSCPLPTLLVEAFSFCRPPAQLVEGSSSGHGTFRRPESFSWSEFDTLRAMIDIIFEEVVIKSRWFEHSVSPGR